jgi:hypothetical protein
VDDPGGSHRAAPGVQDRGGWKPPVLTGVAVGVLYYFAYGPTVSGGALRGEALLQNSFFAGVIVALISIPFWRLGAKTRFVIRLEQGVLSWRGPDKQKHSIAPEEPRRMQVMAHRWADEERRKHDNWRSSHPRQSAPKPLFQTMIRSGPFPATPFWQAGPASPLPLPLPLPWRRRGGTC